RPGGVEVLSPPQDLLPLTYELPEWRERAIEEVKMPKEEPEQSFYLLADTDTFHQDSLKLEIQKPTTTFWNWYAWLGENARQNSSEGGQEENSKSLAQLALEKELENRETSFEGNQPEGNPPREMKNVLCDPAVSGKVLVELYTLFPTPASVVSRIIDPEPHSFLDDPTLKVTIDINAESQNLYFDEDSIKVPKGHVVQVKISFLIEPAYFDGEKPMFHSFMGKGFDFFYVGNQKFRKTPPVELFFETAKTSSVSE